MEIRRKRGCRVSLFMRPTNDAPDPDLPDAVENNHDGGVCIQVKPEKGPGVLFEIDLSATAFYNALAGAGFVPATLAKRYKE